MKRQTVTYIILLVLLALRFSGALATLLATPAANHGVIPNWALQFEIWTYRPLLLGSLPLISCVVFLNRSALDKLNMDRSFIVIFLFSEVMVILESFVLNPIVGFLALAAWLLILYGLLRNKFAFGGSGVNLGWPYVLIAIVFAAVLLLISPTLNPPRIQQNILYFFADAIPMSLMEEVVFRSMLWTLLRNLNWKEGAIFRAQTVIFWIAHFDRMVSNPLLFWVQLPIVSALLGYIVLRLKSIGPSTFVHVLLNLLIELSG